MSEPNDISTTTTAPVAVAAAPEPARPNRVTQAVAWVGIVAGVIFIVAVIFFSGFILGKSSDGGGHHRGGHDREMTMFHRGGPPMGPPHAFFPGGPGGQAGQQGPQQQPITPARP